MKGIRVRQQESDAVGRFGASGTDDQRIDNPVKGILLMVMGSTLITFNDAATKVVTEEHSISQAILVRGLFSLIPICFIAWRFGGWTAVRWNSFGAQAVCAAPLVVSLFLFVWSLSFIPIAVATIMLYLSPLFVTALAPLFGEKVGWRRWGAVFLGFAGAVFVIEPQGADFSWWLLTPVAAALALSVRELVTRRVIANETALSMLTVSTVAVIVAAAPPSILDWSPLSWTDYGLLAFSGLSFGFSLFLLTDAFRFAEASVLSPVKYSGVIMAAILGFAVWGDVPSFSAVFGAVIIVVSVLIILRREYRRDAIRSGEGG